MEDAALVVTVEGVDRGNKACRGKAQPQRGSAASDLRPRGRGIAARHGRLPAAAVVAAVIILRRRGCRHLDGAVRVAQIPVDRVPVHRHAVRVHQIHAEGEFRILVPVRHSLADLGDLQIARLRPVGELRPVLVIGDGRAELPVLALRNGHRHGLRVPVIAHIRVAAVIFADGVAVGADGFVALVHQHRELEHAACHRGHGQ